MSSRSRFFVISSSSCLVVLLLLGAVVGKSAAQDEPYRQLGVFAEVLGRIKSDYVEEPEMKNVTLGAMNGMLEAIDPYASYLNADQYKQYVKSRAGKMTDVGLILSKRYGYVGIIEAVPGSPAAKAGLNTNDMLESINGVATRDMPLAYAEMLLQGEPGSSIEVSVMRVTQPEPQKMTLTRAAVKYPEVSTKMLADQVGLVTVPSLDPGKAADVAKAVEALQKQGAARLILDLRNNATGTPEEGIALADALLETGLITYRQGQKMPRENVDAKPGSVAAKLPMVVLANRGTANGAEIAAAALQDSKRAEVVGERTYGDAAVRRAIGLDDGSAVILSVAKYYSPAGKAIQDTGVTPAVQVDAFEPAPEADDDNPATPPSVPSSNKPKVVAPEDDPFVKKGVERVKAAAMPAAA